MRVADVEMDFFLGYLQQSPGDILRRNDTEHATKVSSIQSAIATLDKEILKITELTATLSIDELKSRLIKFTGIPQGTKAGPDPSVFRRNSTGCGGSALRIFSSFCLAV
jgi:hypothetical protein